jgi:hypothetical protein
MSERAPVCGDGGFADRRRRAGAWDGDHGSDQCELSTTCLACGASMREEHAHYRCPECGWRDSCCDGPY